MYTCGQRRMTAGVCSSHRCSISLEVRLQVVVRHPRWVPRTKLGSSPREVLLTTELTTEAPRRVLLLPTRRTIAHSGCLRRNNKASSFKTRKKPSTELSIILLNTEENKNKKEFEDISFSSKEIKLLIWFKDLVCLTVLITWVILLTFLDFWEEITKTSNCNAWVDGGMWCVKKCPFWIEKQNCVWKIGAKYMSTGDINYTANGAASKSQPCSLVRRV